MNFMVSEISFNKELSFKTSRSSGKGGQSVNKVATKVELNFDVMNTTLLTEEQKAMVFEKLKNRINKEGVLQLVSDSERTQLANKRLVIQRFYKLMDQCFTVPKERIPTRPSVAKKEKRLKNKKMQSMKKDRRKEI